MTKSRIKRVSAIFLAFILIITYAVSVSAAAQSLEYSASSSYKNSSFYKKLTQVKLTGDQVTDIVNVAKSQVGYHEGYSSSDYSGYASGSGNVTEYGRWYGRQGYWCNIFVSWCANVAGVPASIFPKLSGVGNAYYSTMPSVNAECFSFSSGKKLEAGDLIFSCTCSGSYGCIDHVGLVTAVDENTIYTVEGNMSDMVKACSYPASTGYSSYYHARINYVARPCYEDNSKGAEELTDATASVSFANNVYTLFDTSVSYKEAVALSEQMGGTLASPETEKEIEKLSALAEQGGFGRYYVTSEKDCAIISYGKLTKASENRRATGFICKISLDNIKPTNSASFGGSKYEIYDNAVTYEQAKAIAKAKGGKLTVIENETEAMMISLLLKDSKTYFTGAKGTKKELVKLFDNFADNVKFEKEENIVTFLNNGSKEFGVSKGVSKTGFIIEYNEKEKCTVLYDANGGENAPIEKITESGETMEITSVIPTNKNKVFKGWAFSENAKTATIKTGEKIAPVGNITLYAVWG